MEQNTTSDPPVLIIGAGIAGLALAQGLRLRSIPFRLFERYPQSRSSQGHRFRISKDGQAALDSVLSPELQDLLRRTEAERYRFEPRYVDAKKLEFAKQVPADPVSMPVGRTWIRMLLTLNIDDAVEYDREFESYRVVGDQVQVRFVDGSTALGRLLVGADGIRSRVRAELQSDRRLLDLERWLMWGRTPLTDDLEKSVPRDMLTWCMYQDPESNVQTIVDPMMWSKSVRKESNARLPDFPGYIYWVVCTAPFQYSKVLPKTASEKSQALERVAKTWHPALKLLLSSANHDLTACIPVLSSKPDIRIRSSGRTGLVTLIGDAAHPMSPMGGSGGDTAVRSAADLAQTIAEGGTKSGVAEFESRMEERAKERIEHSFRGGQKFWQGKEWTEYNEVNL
ncbi:FAD/NAD(P)-binding domain-containing protein [Daldinia sp. FL1419]|nr:FAD/NAD(P)-binding domain-containing protein [Daldinia sp. FL1419]